MNISVFYKFTCNNEDIAKKSKANREVAQEDSLITASETLQMNSANKNVKLQTADRFFFIFIFLI